MSVITTSLRPATFAGPRSAAWALPAGLASGLAVGVVARVWMRLIAEDPEFSWAGTLFIVGAFGVFGTAQGAAWAGRRRGWRRGAVTPLRAGALVLSLPIFTGAGSIMLPVVATAALASWRTDWHRAARVVLAVLSAPIAVFVITDIIREFGLAPATFVRVGLFLAIYAVVVVALRPTVEPQDDGWRFSRRAALITALVATGLALLAFLSAIGA